MLKLLKANIVVNLQFYIRNKLILFLAMILLVGFGFSLVPILAYSSVNERFNNILFIINEMVYFAKIFLAAVALISIWYHTSNKCVKLIFTKPCSPELWVLSHYLSAALVYLVMLIFIFFIYTLLSFIYGVNFQSGVFVWIFVKFVYGMILFSYLLMLSSWFHPVVAFLISTMFSESVFYYLAIMFRNGKDFFDNIIAVTIFNSIGKVFKAVYYTLPDMSPLIEKFDSLNTGLRLPANWITYMIGIFVYTTIFFAFSYSLTVFSLRKKRF